MCLSGDDGEVAKRKRGQSVCFPWTQASISVSFHEDMEQALTQGSRLLGWLAGWRERRDGEEAADVLPAFLTSKQVTTSVCFLEIRFCCNTLSVELCGAVVSELETPSINQADLDFIIVPFGTLALLVCFLSR